MKMVEGSVETCQDLIEDSIKDFIEFEVTIWSTGQQINLSFPVDNLKGSQAATAGGICNHYFQCFHQRIWNA